MDKTCTKHGQNMDKTWTKHGQNNDKTWTKHGQNMDKTCNKYYSTSYKLHVYKEAEKNNKLISMKVKNLAGLSKF